MKAILSLIDNNCAMRAWLKQSGTKVSLKQHLRKTINAPWVARVKEDNSFEFLRGQVDYSTSDSVGTRGVVYRFVLDSKDKYKACTYERGKAIIKYYKVTETGEIVGI